MNRYTIPEQRRTYSRIFQHPHSPSIVVIDKLDNDGHMISTRNIKASKWRGISLTNPIYVKEET